MHNFKIGFDFVKHFFESNVYNLGDLILKNKSICTFNNTAGLDTQRFDKKKILIINPDLSSVCMHGV